MSRRVRNKPRRRSSAPTLRPAAVIGPGPLGTTAEELEVRALEREAVAAYRAAGQAAEALNVLRSDERRSAVDVERSAEESARLERHAAELLGRALTARLHLDVTLNRPEAEAEAGEAGEDAAQAAALDRGGHDQGHGIDVVSWNQPGWSWEQLVAAALDEPVPDPGPGGTPTAEQPGPSPSDPPVGEVEGHGSPGRAGAMIVRPSAAGVPLDTGRRDGSRGSSVDENHRAD